MDNALTLVVVDPVKAMLIKIWSYIPAIAGAIAILVIGWLVAKLLEAVIVRVLKSLRLDAACDKAGISNVLAQGDIKLTVSELIGALIYWIAMLVVIATALNALNLTVAADLLSKLVSYIPNILMAVFVLILGSFLASFVAAVVRTAASNVGVERAKLLAQISQTVLIIFAIIVAIEQLNIATALVALGVNIILASIGLSIALAFGLGCKDIAGKFVSDLINKFKK